MVSVNLNRAVRYAPLQLLPDGTPGSAPDDTLTMTDSELQLGLMVLVRRYCGYWSSVLQTLSRPTGRPTCLKAWLDRSIWGAERREHMGSARA